MRALKLTADAHEMTIPLVTTQAHEGIETDVKYSTDGINAVTTQAHEGIETLLPGY